MASTGPLAKADVIVSSGMYRRLRDFDPEDSNNAHRTAMQGVDYPQLHTRLRLDRSAIDTVGNFTTTVGLLEQLGHQHVVLVTSTNHMRRAAACAAIVLGSHGISFTAVSCEPAAAPPVSHFRQQNDRLWHKALCWCRTNRYNSTNSNGGERTHSESWVRTVRDVCRCVFWVLTGYDGESIARWRHPDRH